MLSYHIFVYDVPSSKELEITDPNTFASNPNIYESKIVYEDNSGQQIFLHTILTNQDTIIVNGTTTQYSPAIYEDSVVWVGVDPISGFHEIYLYN